MKTEDVIRELQAILHSHGLRQNYSSAKDVFRFARDGFPSLKQKHFLAKLGAGGVKVARFVTHEEAEAWVALAKTRIAAADEE